MELKLSCCKHQFKGVIAQNKTSNSRRNDHLKVHVNPHHKQVLGICPFSWVTHKNHRSTYFSCHFNIQIGVPNWIIFPIPIHYLESFLPPKHILTFGCPQKYSSQGWIVEIELHSSLEALLINRWLVEMNWHTSLQILKTSIGIALQMLNCFELGLVTKV